MTGGAACRTYMQGFNMATEYPGLPGQWADAGRRILEHVTTEQLNDNTNLDPTLIFRKTSPMLAELNAIRDQFVKHIEHGPLPPDFRSPIELRADRRPKSLRNVECLIANIYSMKSKGKAMIALPFSPSQYSNTRLSSSGIINLVKLAAHPSRGLLILHKGFRDPNNRKKSRLGRIRPTDEFVRLIDSIVVADTDIASEPADLIVLRRGPKNKKLDIPRKVWEKEIAPARAKQLDDSRRLLEWFNRVFLECRITYRRAGSGKIDFLFPILYRVYNDDFEHGGRFYTGRNGHQGLNKAVERKTIQFDGCPTIELDFGGLHIRMLYHLAGADYPMDADPYTDVLNVMVGKEKAKSLFREFPEIRDDLKIMLLALINGKATRKQRIANASHRLFHRWWQIKDRTAMERVRLECERRKSIWTKAGLSVESVLSGFAKAHKRISKYFATGKGLDLQSLDAAMAERVMVAMMPTQDVHRVMPTLPMHDSFIVARKYEQKLRTAMAAAYQTVMRNRTGSAQAFRVPIRPGK